MQLIAKTMLLSAFVAFSSGAFSQQSEKIRKVDSLVILINNSDFKIQRDSITQELPELGLSMKTYLLAIVDGSELKKYVNNVHTTTTENGVVKKMVTTNTFYFDQNKLIKVEESGKTEDKEMEMLWYYENETPLYYTLKSEKAQERAEQLLMLAKAMLQQFKP